MSAAEDKRAGRRAGQIAHLVISLEARMWVSLFRWILRRPVCGPGETAFAYTRRITPILGAFIGVSAIEIPILDLILPWQTVRVIADILGAYGLIWMVGLLATLRVNPHVVTESGLRVRGGNGLDITIPWDYLASIQANNRSLQGRETQVQRVGDEAVLSIGVLKETNVDIAFRDPTTLELPRGETEPLRGLRIAVDEPAAMVTLVRSIMDRGRLATRSGTPPSTI